MNRVRSGSIGLAGASGTGIQEMACRIHHNGKGVSQAIGTGSRDLSLEVNGRMTELALSLLADDPDTQVIGLVAKQPHPDVAERLHGILAASKKPVTVRYLGQARAETRDGVVYCASLDDAAFEACACLPGREDTLLNPYGGLSKELEALRSDHPGASGRLVGLFGGGSLALEAMLVLRQAGLDPQLLDRPLVTEGGVEGSGHLILDCGEDFYTRGRPHPMVDQSQRCELIEQVGRDPSVGILLLDVVLGDGAHPDPAPELAKTVRRTREIRGGRPLAVIASVTGTPLDPQDAVRQTRELVSASIHVQPSAARAARAASTLLTGDAP
jgi:hypothetical protein